MDIQIASDIKDLLMENGEVIIPGLGGFISTYKPAVTDGVLGVLHPPSYHLTFDANQQTNDGKLVEYIREKYNVSSGAAQEVIDTFVKEAHSNFEKNEIVDLPQVGRLYNDFMKKVQFLPESTNFNADTFGLPTLNFAPISRTKPEPVKSASVAPIIEDKDTQAQPTIEPQTAYKERVKAEFLTPIDDVPPPTIINRPKRNDWLPENWRDYAPALAVALIALLAVLVWYNTGDSNTEGGRKLENEKPKINVSPHDATQNSATAQGVPPQQPTVPQTPPTDTQAITNESFFVDKQKQEGTSAAKPELNKSQASHTATVIIGGFANKSNINRLKKWITEQGYGVYEKKKSKGLTEIGCEVGYNTKDEFNRILRKIKARYGDDLQIIQNK